MTNPRSKSETLSKTCLSYVEDWAKEQIYGRKKEFSSKYTQKGIICEDNSLDFVADQLKLGMLLKNEEHFSSDFMTGTPDAILKDLIIDVKNSWDCFSFPLMEKDIPSKDYWWQGQGYMELTGRDNYKLIYVLSDTPAHLIEKEAYYYAKNNGFDELDQDIYQEFVDKMTYPDIPAKFKIKVFEFQKDQAAIDSIKKRVEEINIHIQTNYSNLLK